MTTKTERTGITLLSINGVAPDHREDVKAAIVAGCGSPPARYEAWVVAARRPPAYIVRIIGPSGFYREEKFAGRETPVEIAQRIRQTMAGGVHAAPEHSEGSH